MCGNSAYDWNTMLTSRSLAARSVTSLPPMSTRPLGHGLEPRDHAQRRRLAAARRAEQRDELALRDLERDVVDGGDVAVLLGHAIEDDATFGFASMV